MNKLFSKIAALSVGLAMAVGVGVALGHQSVREVRAAEELSKSYDLANALPSDLTSSVSLTKDSNGRGMGKGGATYTLTTSDSFTNVTKVVVNAATNYGKYANHSISITVGGADFDSAKNFTAKASTDYTFEASAASGAVVVSLNNSAAGTTKSNTIWVKTIEIYVESSSEGPFTVTYNGNGATSGSMSDTKEYESGETVTIMACGYMRTYYEVTGWNTKADGTGTAYGLSAQFTITSNVTLYAQWDLASVELANGNYKAILSYANPMPSSIQLINEANNQQVGVIGVTPVSVTYDDTHSEYLVAASGVGKITFKNPTNAPLIKANVNVYQFDNFNLKLGSTTIHTGDGTKGSGDPVVHECVPSTPSTDDVVLEHYSTSSTYNQKLYGVELYFKIGSEVVHPTSVELNAESGNVYVGKTRQLTANVLPTTADDKTVSWSSNNTAVATVDVNGLVTGVAAGSATITVTTNDGSLTDTFVATVKALSYGSATAPLAVEEAREVLEITGSSASSEQLFVGGVVYSSSYDSTKGYTIWLKSSDGSVNQYFEVFKASLDSSIEGDYTASNALRGLFIVARGYGMIYSGTTYELTPANSVAPTVLSVGYNAQMIAELVLSETAELCNAYVDGTSDYDEYKTALTTIWSGLASKYSTLLPGDKTILVEAERDEEGSVVEQAMARYDFLTGKYVLNNFIEGRTPIQSNYNFAPAFDNNNSYIIIIVISAVSVMSFGLALFLRKKRSK